MAKYIEVINDKNVVSVDDTQPRLSLLRSAKLNTIEVDKYGRYNWGSEYEFGNNQYRTQIFYRFPIGLGAAKMFSLRALESNPHVGFAICSVGNSLFYLYAYLNMNYSDNTFDSNYIIDFYGYDAASKNPVGLEVFDASGNRVFNSNNYYLDVKGQYNIQHPDLWRSRFYSDTTKFPRKIEIGNYSRSNSAVVLNGNPCGMTSYFNSGDLPPYDIVYTVVFNDTIYLEPRIAFWVNNWSTYTNPTGHIAYPNFSRVSSGIILDTTNIS